MVLCPGAWGISGTQRELTEAVPALLSQQPPAWVSQALLNCLPFLLAFVPL